MRLIMSYCYNYSLKKPEGRKLCVGLNLPRIYRAYLVNNAAINTSTELKIP